MGESSVSKKHISIRYGLISGLVGIAFFVVLNLIGLGTHQGISWLAYVIMAAIIYLAHKAFKEEGDGYMSYGQGLGIGTLVSLLSAVVGGVFTYIYVAYINTDYIQEILDKTREQMEKGGQQDAVIDQAMGIIEKATSPTIMPILGLVSTVFFGFIISLIVSAITQNKRPENELA